MQTKVYNIKGEHVGEINLNDEVFAVPYNEAVIHQVVVATLANGRQGAKLEAVAESHGDKRELVTLVKVPSVLHNGLKVAWYSLQNQEISLRK